MALGAAGAVTAVAAIVAVAQRPAPTVTPITASVLRTRLLAAIDTARGDILYTPAPGRTARWRASTRRIHSMARRSMSASARTPTRAGWCSKTGSTPSGCRPQNALHDYINSYTANLDQGGLKLSGTAMSVDHFAHIWRECQSTFILGFTLDAAGIRAEIANGQFKVIGRIELNGQQAVELRINVPPKNEAPPHVTAERMWVNATTYLPMRDFVRWSDGQRSASDYVFLPPTPSDLAKLRPAIPAGYTRAGCAHGHWPGADALGRASPAVPTFMRAAKTRTGRGRGTGRSRRSGGASGIR